MEFFLNLLCGAILGSVFGSFFAATVQDYAAGNPIMRKRSICDSCGAKLPARALVPVFGYLFLKGKCQFCGRKIPLFYLLMEIVPAILAMVFIWRNGLNCLSICRIILSTAIISACLMDVMTRKLPDIITIGLLALLPAELVLDPDLTLKDSIIGYIAGAAFPLILGILFKALRRKEGLGTGDVKLYALAGAFLGWQALPFLYFFSALSGILAFLPLAPFLKKDLMHFQLPFGPCIGTIFILALIFPTLPARFYFMLYSWTNGSSVIWM